MTSDKAGRSSHQNHHFPDAFQTWNLYLDAARRKSSLSRCFRNFSFDFASIVENLSGLEQRIAGRAATLKNLELRS
jgi:hypothetical protein